MADATERKVRSGTTAEVNAMTPALAELVGDNTKKTAVMGDGATAGGIPLLREDLDNYDGTRAIVTFNLAALDTSAAASIGGLLTALASLAVTGTGAFSNIVTVSRAAADGGVNLIRTGSATANGHIWANSDLIKFGDDSGGNPNNTRMSINTTNGNVVIAGALSKGSGSFRIDHPLAALSATRQLVHSFVESPRAENLYSGMTQLVSGKATVNLDEAAGMTEGTFEAVNALLTHSSSNESGFDPVICSVSGNILSIECANPTDDVVYWEVRGERKDQHMLETSWTDSEGHVITEPQKEGDLIQAEVLYGKDSAEYKEVESLLLEEDQPDTVATKTEEVQMPVVEMVDGRAILKMVPTPVESPVYDFYPIFDEDGNAVVDPKDPTKQAMHRVPVIVAGKKVTKAKIARLAKLLAGG